MQNSQERALIEAAAGGDPTAFEKLMRMHEGKMYAVALRMARAGRTRRIACRRP